MENTLYTIGHSSHEVGKVIGLLRRHGVTALADVRSQPSSRRNPQFNRDPFTAALREQGIVYVFLGRELGGRPEDRSCYLDGRVVYDRVAATEWFQLGLERVIHGMQKHRIALLCAEKDPLDCHRGILLAPQLTARGVNVVHILEDGRLESHEAALSRLLARLGLEESCLFGSREERVAEAYSQRAAQIAYTEPAAVRAKLARGAPR